MHQDPALISPTTAGGIKGGSLPVAARPPRPLPRWLHASTSTAITGAHVRQDVVYREPLPASVALALPEYTNKATANKNLDTPQKLACQV